jgi:hypothetical protein
MGRNMTKSQIRQRITEFENEVQKHSARIAEAGSAAWIPIKEDSETPSVRAFLVQKNAGIDFLNKSLARLLSKNGRVVKFAGLFLHGTPMVNGWLQGKGPCSKKWLGTCELADLMTVFLYVDKNKTVKRMRCVLFQAKMKPSPGPFVISNEDIKQRRLYDECVGFKYAFDGIAPEGSCRTLPTGTSRRKALQYLFVEPRPVEVCTTPADKRKGQFKAYGDHLVSFLTGKTGLNHGRRKDDWSTLIMELMANTATKLHTNGTIKGPGIQDLLKYFNSFEAHDVWNIDDGQDGEGLGVQLVIIWDGEMEDDAQTADTTPKMPVSVMQTDEGDPKEVQDLEEELGVEEAEEVAVELT